MKPQTLAQQARNIVTMGTDRSPTYKTLNTSQREILTAAAMRDAGKHAYEFISNSGFLDSLAGTLINALETKDADVRKELLIKLGEILIDGAVEESQKPIDDALDSAVTELAVNRQFYDDGEHDYKHVYSDPMNRAIYNSPNL